MGTLIDVLEDVVSVQIDTTAGRRRGISKRVWFHKLSSLDYRDVGEVSEAFKMVYEFYIPEDATVLDLCCGKKIMYGDHHYPNVEFNDIRTDLDADYHYDCRDISKYLDKRYDWFIYDPPYVDIKGRTDKRDDDYGYKMVGSLEDFEIFTKRTKDQIMRMINLRGGIIAKITDFHWDAELHGHHDLIEWFEPEFFIWDLRTYRWYRRAVNINWYKKKCFKTHSYFLIFKPRAGKRFK